VILSPPGVAEAPVPEPTALATLTLAIAAIGLRAGSRNRAAKHHIKTLESDRHSRSLQQTSSPLVDSGSSSLTQVLQPACSGVTGIA